MALGWHQRMNPDALHPWIFGLVVVSQVPPSPFQQVQLHCVHYPRWRDASVRFYSLTFAVFGCSRNPHAFPYVPMPSDPAVVMLMNLFSFRTWAGNPDSSQNLDYCMVNPATSA